MIGKPEIRPFLTLWGSFPSDGKISRVTGKSDFIPGQKSASRKNVDPQQVMHAGVLNLGIGIPVLIFIAKKWILKG